MFEGKFYVERVESEIVKGFSEEWVENGIFEYYSWNLWKMKSIKELDENETFKVF